MNNSNELTDAYLELLLKRENEVTDLRQLLHWVKLYLTRHADYNYILEEIEVRMKQIDDSTFAP